MCRFVVYAGPPLRMSVLLTESAQSLIKQSYRARERQEPLNGDGFGIGWYPDDAGVEPCVFTSVSPAWSNRNLLRLSTRLSATRVFAHVRAASPGIAVTELNCHPFQAGRLLWMHNGRISCFDRVRRRLRESLPDELYNAIEGNGDTEHIFALFRRQLGAPANGGYTTRQLQEAMLETIEQLNVWTAEAGIAEPSFYNFAMTDGEHIVATRYVSDPRAQPETLYFSRGHSLSVVAGRYRMAPSAGRPQAVIIASEPLTTDPKDWQPIPPNHMLAVSPDLETEFTAIPFGFRERYTA